MRFKLCAVHKIVYIGALVISDGSVRAVLSTSDNLNRSKLFDRINTFGYSVSWTRKQQDFVEVNMEDKAIVVSMTEENQVGQVSLDEILAEIRFNWIDMYRAAYWSP